ncbi:MAG: phenylacetic acid degradation operon negative regulatory protein [Ilumatobacteraceae bacterium]|jgi:phenylacetic acid degradation operon negative regulatory protein
MSSGRGRKSSSADVEAAARFHEFGELDMPRFQVGFPPQHLLLALLGDYWSGRREALPSAALVDLLAEFDVNPSGARAALSRLSIRGLLVGTKDGRNTSYRVADGFRSLLPYGPIHTRAFAKPAREWDGMWTTVAFTVPEDQRRLRPMLRARLQSLGFAPLYDGLWVSPHAPDNDLDIALQIAPAQSCTVMRATELPTRTRLAVASAWNLDDLGASYAEFIRTFRPVLRRLRTGRIGSTEALVSRTRANYRWFVFAVTDPDLPEALLPDRWPRAVAHDLFVGLADGLAAPAVERVREIVSKYDRDLGKLVRLRASEQIP